MNIVRLTDGQLAKLEYIVADYADRVLEGDVEGHTEVDAAVAQDILDACAAKEKTN
jgi:hypothetical protein